MEHKGKAYTHVRRDIADPIELNALADKYTQENPGKQLFIEGDIVLLHDESMMLVDGTDTFQTVSLTPVV